MPVQNKSPVKNHTTIATRIAGISTKNSFMSTMITKPMMTSIIRKVRSKPPSPKLSSTEYTNAKKTAKEFIFILKIKFAERVISFFPRGD
jgi:hypothetical protein